MTFWDAVARPLPKASNASVQITERPRSKSGFIQQRRVLRLGLEQILVDRERSGVIATVVKACRLGAVVRSAPRTHPN